MANPYVAAVGMGLNALGGALTAQQQADLQKRQMAQQQSQFDTTTAYGAEAARRQAQDNEAGAANSLQQQNALAPLRDRAAFALANRLGMTPQQFQPRDIYNGSPVSGGPTPNQGGINLNQLGQQNAGYQSGAGGQMNTSLQNAILGRLGYTQGQNGQYTAGPAQITAPTGSAAAGSGALPPNIKDFPGAEIYAAHSSMGDALPHQIKAAWNQYQQALDQYHKNQLGSYAPKAG